MVGHSKRYKAYPEYKDSGVEWLGEIPPHWEISKLRYMFDFGSGLNITKANLKDTGIPCINYGEVHSKFGFEVDTKRHELKCVDERYLVSNPSALLHKGDLVFADTSEDIEGSGNFTQLVSDEPTFAGYHTVIVRPKNDDCSRFYAYLMDSKEIRTQIRHIVKGVKVFTISQSILKGVNIWLPSLEERQTIANFLDYETAKIDTLIEKQQRLIELLTEKRQAVISHAVTKGLNPEAPMKDSGVEWLGEVPAHWEVTKVGYHALKIGSGKTPRGGSEVYLDEGVLFLRSQNVYDDGLRIGESESVFISQTTHDEMSNSRVFDGDILLNITGGSIGRSCLVPSGFAEANVNQHVCIIRVPEYLQEYLAYVMKSLSIKVQIDSIQSGSNREGVNFEQIANFVFCLPDFSEIKEIVSYIRSEEIRFISLMNKAQQVIQLMQERRTAVISAAVTGKIDVRGWVRPESNPNQIQ